MSETAITIPAPAAPAAAATAWPGVHLWHEHAGFSFHDLLDTINPLQHIPIIGTIYRAITDDEPGAIPRVAGDGLFGGLYGLIGGLVNVLVEAESGKDIGAHVLAMVGLGGSDGATTPETAVASGPSGPSPRGGGRGPMPLSPSRYLVPTAASAPTAAATGGALPAPSAATGTALAQRPVPLRGAGLLLPNSRPRPLIAAAPSPNPSGATPPPAVTNAPGSTVSLPAAPAPTPAAGGAGHPAADPAPGPSVGLSQNPPVEISQQMMDALDKYARLLQERQGKAAAGGQVNVVQ